jgi:hypothetical protein
MSFLRSFRRFIRLIQIAVDVVLLVFLPVALALFTIFVIEEKVPLRGIVPLLWGPEARFSATAVALVLLMVVSAFLSGFLTAWDRTGKWLTRKKAP